MIAKTRIHRILDEFPEYLLANFVRDDTNFTGFLAGEAESGRLCAPDQRRVVLEDDLGCFEGDSNEELKLSGMYPHLETTKIF